jgi:hypothetical protein
VDIGEEEAPVRVEPLRIPDPVPEPAPASEPARTEPERVPA